MEKVVLLFRNVAVVMAYTLNLVMWNTASRAIALWIKQTLQNLKRTPEMEIAT